MFFLKELNVTDGHDDKLRHSQPSSLNHIYTYDTAALNATDYA